jgi:hypothetical protein
MNNLFRIINKDGDSILVRAPTSQIVDEYLSSPNGKGEKLYDIICAIFENEIELTLSINVQENIPDKDDTIIDLKHFIVD